MVMMERVSSIIQAQREIAPDIWEMTLHVPQVASDACPGQFVNLYMRDEAHLLPRPISLAQVDRDKGMIRLIYRVSGAGTESFSRMRAGDVIDLLGPLGNGFPLAEAEGCEAILVGGGIGIPPMLETARVLHEMGIPVTSVLGYRDKMIFLAREFEYYGEVRIATEDGSIGTPGTVTDVLRSMDTKTASGNMNDPVTALPEKKKILFACGPTPMLKAVQLFAKEQGMAAWLSLEERMACGIGACLACVCRTNEIDSHSQVKNRRVCKDGPVFPAEEIAF